jgi:hypothetical protein
MANEIEEHRVIQTARGITHLAEQKKSRFREAVSIEPNVVGKRASFDQLGSAGDAEMVTSRHMDTPLDDPLHYRRNAVMHDYVKAAMVDEEDLQKVLNDPRNSYSEAIARTFGRKMDDIVIAAALATAITGEDGAGTAAFDTTNYSIASGSEGMTIAKWRSAREILEAAENEEDETDYQWYIAFQARQRRELLSTTEMTDIDYNTVKALVNGQITDFLGMKPIKSQRLQKVTNDRYVLAWVKASLKLAIGSEAHSSIKQRADKNDNWQVLYKGGYGATRMDETGVVRILCDES